MENTFLSENYIWIIVIAVIVVMTIIGYIADKTNFGEKKPKKKIKEKEVNNIENSDESVSIEQDIAVNEDFNDYQNIDSFDMPVVEKNNEEITSFEPEMMDQEVIEPVQPEAIETEPLLDDFEISESEAIDYLQDNIYDQDIAIDDNDDFVNSAENSFENYDVEQPEVTEEQEEFIESEPIINEESIQEVQPVEEVQPVQPEEIDFELPSIDQLNEEIAEVEEDEDVWKF